MLTYIQNNISILGRPGRKTQELLRTEGKLFCPESAISDEYQTGDHGAKHLLLFEPDGRCSAIPSAGSLIFVRFPDNTRECFEYGKPLIQKEIAEAVCICGVCRNWMKGRSEGGSGKRTFKHMPWIGVSNHRFDQNMQDTLAKRMDAWLWSENPVEPTAQYLKRFMLQSLDEPIQDMGAYPHTAQNFLN